MASNKVSRHHGGMSRNGSNGDPMPSKAPAKQSLEKFILSVLPEPVDFRFENHGSICLLRPLTDAAKAWVEEYIGHDNGFQPYYPTVVIEPRYGSDVLSGIAEAGLSVGGAA